MLCLDWSNQSQSYATWAVKRRKMHPSKLKILRRGTSEEMAKCGQGTEPSVVTYMILLATNFRKDVMEQRGKKTLSV